MTFIVETGTGNPLATSYVSVEEADTVIGQNLHAHDWAALTTETKERLLIWASAFLDHRTRWHGRRADYDSGLCWPRIGAVDRDGWTIPHMVIPRALRVATAYMARAQIKRDRSAEEACEGIKMIKVDVLTLSFATNYRMCQIPEHVGRILTGIGRIEGAGVNFKPVAA